jgi:hypothetical protein
MATKIKSKTKKRLVMFESPVMLDDTIEFSKIENIHNDDGTIKKEYININFTHLGKSDELIVICSDAKGSKYYQLTNKAGS